MGELRPADVQLTEMAACLRLTYTRDHLVELVETEATGHMTPRGTLEYVFRKEIEQHDGNRVRLVQMSAHLPFAAAMDGFDMSFQPSIDPGKIRGLVSLGWVISGENVILIDPFGVGKTHLSIALGQLAFYSVTRLVEQMEKAYKAGIFDEKIRDVKKSKLLITDELGYIPFTPLQGQLLFELISARYEKKSIIVTSNKMPGEWGTVFGDAAAATASLDRLLHHCTPMLIQGESYRTRKFSRKMRANKAARNSYSTVPTLPPSVLSPGQDRGWQFSFVFWGRQNFRLTTDQCEDSF